MTKICTKCNKELDKSEFYATNNRWCKTCTKEYRRSYYQANKRRILSYMAIGEREENNVIDAVDSFLSDNGIDFLKLVKDRRGIRDEKLCKR